VAVRMGLTVSCAVARSMISTRDWRAAAASLGPELVDAPSRQPLCIWLPLVFG
jgi:hypothetical protein